MAKFILKPITEESWILLSGGNRLALIYKTKNQFTVIGSLNQKIFNDISELEKFLGGKLVVEEFTTSEALTEEVSEIFGFPIKHANVFEPESEPIPCYRRSINSDVKIAAGYYGILFSTGWIASFCPKLDTLHKHLYIGPFGTKLQMNHEIALQNNRPHEDMPSDDSICSTGPISKHISDSEKL